MVVNLVLMTKNGDPKSFALPSNVTVIGRRRNCDLWIPLDSVSRRHCQLSLEDGTLKVRDLGSRNGTFLNGKRIREAVAHAGDRIQIGPVLLTLQIDGKPARITPPASRPKAEKAASPASDDEFTDLEGSGSFAGLDLDGLDSPEKA